MAGLLEGLVFCANDGMPMLVIDGDYRCVAEYLDESIGVGVAVVSDILTEPATLIFSNGCSLRLLCPCCGQAARIGEDIADEALDGVTGLALIGIAWSEQSPQELVLEFGEPGSEPDGENPLVVHLETARGLQRPAVWVSRLG
jgi:hypothetical protein